MKKILHHQNLKTDPDRKLKAQLTELSQAFIEFATVPQLEILFKLIEFQLSVCF